MNDYLRHALFWTGFGMLIACGGPVFAGAILVDGFSGALGNPPQQTVSVSTPSGDNDNLQGPNPPNLVAVLGFARSLRIQGVVGSDNGPASATVVTAPDGELHIFNDTGVYSSVTVTWSAGDFGLNHPNLDAGNIIGGGNQGLLVSIVDELVGAMDLEFEFVSGDSAGPSSVLKAMLENGFSGSLFLPFTELTPTEGGAVLTDLFSISMLVTSQDPGFSGKIGFVQAAPDPDAVPVPASLPLLFVGLIGLIFARRRFRGR